MDPGFFNYTDKELQRQDNISLYILFCAIRRRLYPYTLPTQSLNFHLII